MKQRKIFESGKLIVAIKMLGKYFIISFCGKKIKQRKYSKAEN